VCLTKTVGKTCAEASQRLTRQLPTGKVLKRPLRVPVFVPVGLPRKNGHQFRRL
jgi:hypothetical protein